MTCQKSRFSLIALGLTFSFTMSLGAQSSQAPDEPWEVRGMGRVIAPLVQASKASVQQTVITRRDTHVSVDILLDGKRRTLNITQYSLRKSDCRFFITDESGRHEIAPPPITTYRGEIAGHPDSSVRASLFQDYFSASIDDGAGGAMDDRTRKELYRQSAWTMERGL